MRKAKESELPVAVELDDPASVEAENQSAATDHPEQQTTSSGKRARSAGARAGRPSKRQQVAAEEARAEVAEPEGLPEHKEERPIPPEAKWYVVHTYSGYENKVRRNLEHRIESMGMVDKIFQVLVPVEEEVDIKDGQRRLVERKVFPGYVLVLMILDEESWSVVRNTPGVTGFVGGGGVSERLRPTPLRPEEVEAILRRMEAEEPTIRVSFRPGQSVRIVDGPFTDFRGVVDAIDMERGKVRLMVNFFGRETPVELDFLQVEV